MEESYGATRERGTGMARKSYTMRISKEVAPPPPPIPRMSVKGAPPPPKLAPRVVTRDKAPAGGRGSLLSEIKTGKALKKVTAVEVICVCLIPRPPLKCRLWSRNELWYYPGAHFYLDSWSGTSLSFCMARILGGHHSVLILVVGFIRHSLHKDILQGQCLLQTVLRMTELL